MIHSVAGGLSSQLCREALTAYSVALAAGLPLTAAALDDRCEAELESRFGLKIDFSIESSLAVLVEWGLVTEACQAGDSEKRAA